MTKHRTEQKMTNLQERAKARLEERIRKHKGNLNHVYTKQVKWYTEKFIMKMSD